MEWRSCMERWREHRMANNDLGPGVANHELGPRRSGLVTIFRIADSEKRLWPLFL
jgi:hypothetical protein